MGETSSSESPDPDEARIIMCECFIVQLTLHVRLYNNMRERRALP